MLRNLRRRSNYSEYNPHRPWPKQQKFLELTCLEALYGGAAGGGKSDTLLMAALQYVHVPGYSALILRRDFARLALPGCIMDRAREWLFHSDAVWNEQRKTFRFPSGAILQFGFIDNPNDRFRYASSEFQFIGWDEFTEFNLSDDENNPYLFMFSRLRRKADLPVPLRMRAATNPGNVGHRWTLNRFISGEAAQAVRCGDHRTFWVSPDRAYIPAAIKDNPSLRADEYRKNLVHLPEVMQERLMNGDWTVAENLQIPSEWFRYYATRGEHLCPINGDGRIPLPAALDCRTLKRFATVDTAGTSQDKADERRGKPPSWSVVAVWDYHAQSDALFLRYVWRERADWGQLKAGVQRTLEDWGCRSVLIENAHVGPPLAVELKGFHCELVGPVIPGMANGYRGAKLDRAIASGLLVRLEGRPPAPGQRGPGSILFPADRTPWLDPFEGELLSWSGDPDEPADQIDVSSYAAYKCRKQSAAWGGHIYPGKA